MEIAIIGAGFAGMGAAHYLKERGRITLFDTGEDSCSRMAAGLLHKFSGLNATKNLFADEALPLALSLIDQKTKTGLLRVASSPKQALSFKKAAETWADEIKQVSENSIWIEEAYVVDCPAYLAPLTYEKRTILSLDELADFDLIILAGGAASLKLAAQLPINPVHGQLIEVAGSPLPATPLTGGVYVIPLADRLIVGATYERTPTDAAAVLLPKLHELLPEFAVTELLAVKGATRASTPDHLPFIKQLSPKVWALAGFGSKGLLYHALYGQKLAHQISCTQRR